MLNTRIDEENGLGEVSLDLGTAGRVLEAIQKKIRQTCWAEGDDRERFMCMARLVRMGYQLAVDNGDGQALLTDLTLQDVEDLYALPTKEGDEDLLTALNELRPVVRRANYVNPLVLHRMAAGLDEVTESLS